MSVLEASAPTIRKTALNAVHRQMGAKMVDFSGWNMPVEYPCSGGLVAEHMAVRTGVGIFDVSHMGDIRLVGPQALAAVQHVSMNDAAKLAIGQAQYSALLYPQGMFVDDVIVHRLGEDEYLLVINAGTREKDFAWVRDNTPQFDCKVTDLSDAYTQIAIQGPKAHLLLQKLTDANLSAVKNYWFTHGTVCALKNVLIGRTGYTGEDGFEISVPADQAEALARTLLDLPEVRPAGLGARDTLRLEAGLCLYGHDINETTTPVEAGLTWAIQKVRRSGGARHGGYPGAAAIDAQLATGASTKRVGLVGLERVPVREGATIVDAHGRKLGVVTSGTLASTVNKPIAMAYLATNHALPHHEVYAEVRGKRQPMRVSPMPFAPHRYFRG